MASRRTEEMTSFIVMDVLERACELECEGKNIIHLEVGEPDFDTPECVKAAACKALTDGFTHYTHSLGMQELREAICTYYQETYGVSVDPDQVVVTSGSSPAIFMTFAALLEPGDEVILSDPHYACYPNFIKFVGGETVSVPVSTICRGLSGSKVTGWSSRFSIALSTTDCRSLFQVLKSPATITGPSWFLIISAISESCLRTTSLVIVKLTMWALTTSSLRSLPSNG